MSAKIRITQDDIDDIVTSGDDAAAAAEQRPYTTTAVPHQQLHSLSVTTDDRNLPRRRRKSQTYMHSCTSLYNSPPTLDLGAAVDVGGSTNSVHRVPSSSTTATATTTTMPSKSRDRSVPNVNFYIPPDIDGHGERETDPHHRARVNLNLSLKNVCAPARRDSHAPSSIGSHEDDGTNGAAEGGDDERGAASTTEAAEENNNSLLSSLMRSWTKKFRSCVNGANSNDKSTTSHCERVREASVASVLPTEKSQQSTSSRILRAFSHVGEGQSRV